MLSRFFALALLPCLSAAYSFNFESTPVQCGNLSISITGSGSPPYSVLVIPVGPSPLENNTEVRKIAQHNFTGSDTSISFQLKYPEDSQFVAVVSDSTGFGSGGTSGVVTVLAGDSSSCYSISSPVTPSWVYSLAPNSLTQCSGTRIWWDPTAGLVQGYVAKVFNCADPLKSHAMVGLRSSRVSSQEDNPSPSPYQPTTSLMLPKKDLASLGHHRFEQELLLF